MPYKSSFLYLPAIILLLAACHSNDYSVSGGGNLRFSHEHLNFDTVLAPIGSGTAHFTVYNNSSQNIVIEQITLNKGNLSPFIININGQRHSATGVRVAKKDSILIFVEVRPNQFFIVSDSVVFGAGSAVQYFPLTAYVQSTAVFEDTIFDSDIHFTNSEPYLFLGNVVIENGATATIDAGSHMLFARDKGLQVNGRLQVNGSKDNPVLFAAARYRTAWYAEQKGQWEGISIGSAGTDNVIEYAVINGAATAVAVEDTLQTGADIQIVLRQCSVSYADHHLCVRGGRTIVDSSVFSNKIKNDTIILTDSNSPVCF
jgi:hypothetical protein